MFVLNACLPSFAIKSALKESTQMRLEENVRGVLHYLMPICKSEIIEEKVSASHSTNMQLK
jgi:benzoyl-CoA reductase/2-hydroxyglutaryl-CoA dehydratase subunit BcrC/BadD/HgdB